MSLPKPRVAFLSLLLLLLLPCPAAPADWEWHNPLPTGHDIFSAWMHDADNVVAGNDHQMLRTTDGWSSWTDSPAGVRIEDIHFANSTDGLAVGALGLILKTTDGGFTWTPQVSGTMDGLNAVRMTDPNTAYIVKAFEGILKTNDGGTSWTVLLGSPTAEQTWGLTGLDFIDDNTGIAVSGIYESAYWNPPPMGTVFRTVDAGITWTSQVSGTSDHLRDVAYVDAQTVVAIGTLGDVIRSLDGGVTWGPVTIANSSRLLDLVFVSSTTGLICGDDGVMYCSTDAGATWAAVTVPPNRLLRKFSFVDANVGMVVGRDGLILKTADGGQSWDYASPRLSLEHLNDVWFADPSVGTLVGHGGEIMRTTDGGRSWTHQNSGTDMAVLGISMAGSQDAVAVGEDGLILRTTDGGITWSSETSGTDQDLVGVFCVNASTAVAVAWNEVFRTADGGASWQVLDPLEYPDYASYTSVWFVDADVGYIGSRVRPSILKTIDGGATWTDANSGVTSRVYDIVFVDPAVGFAVGDRFHATTDGGITWEERPAPAHRLRGVSFFDLHNGVAVGEFGEIHETTDGGFTWAQVIHPHVFAHFTGAFMTGPGAGVVCGGHGSLLIAAEEVSGISDAAPSATQLQQNYPNPFNPTTTIGYTVSVAGFVDLRIYDVRGRMVGVLRSQFQAPGEYTVTWDGVDERGDRVVSGVYFYRLSVGDVSHTQRMVLLK